MLRNIIALLVLGVLAFAQTAQAPTCSNSPCILTTLPGGGVMSLTFDSFFNSIPFGPGAYFGGVLTYDGNGGKKWMLPSAPVSSFADAETPGGAVDGINRSFSLAHPPIPLLSLQFFRNGVLQRAASDYVTTGAVVLTMTPPSPGDTLQAFYRY
jgi:hypothetical protein